MSKLIEKLNNLNKVKAPAMGFRRIDTEEKTPCMVVICEISNRNEEEIGQLSRAGAVAGLVDPAEMSAAALARLMKVKGDIIFGLVVGGNKGVNQKAFNGDVDFIIFEPGLALGVFEGRDLGILGKIMKIDMFSDPGLLRSINNIYPPVDAVVVDLRVSMLKIEHALACRRVADLIGRPIIALTGKTLLSCELIAMRESGVKGLILPPDADVEAVAKLVTDIANLPGPIKRKEPDRIVLVPPVGIGAAPEKQDDDEDDE
jgi:hypothetical protein